ncbi:MAG: PTS sugar transporter subunit IIA [Elusimicrobiota bacterium]|jgi:PTS system ascorbate-specific IIA component|nr:PTS sugar transporter subunit IIA [Elusimicrobiota bacterium]
MEKELKLFQSVRVVEKVKDWQEAITVASQPLLDGGFIKAEYIDAMIDSVNKLGFYIVLTEGVAMPHARSEKGAINTGIAFMKLNTPVLFGTKETFIILPLSAKDSETHMEYMIKIADFLDDPDRLAKLKELKTEAEIEAFLEKEGYR